METDSVVIEGGQVAQGNSIPSELQIIFLQLDHMILKTCLLCNMLVIDFQISDGKSS